METHFENVTVPKDEVFHSNDKEAIWSRFCGFLDLSLGEFMDIQKRMLAEEIDLVADTTIGKKLMNNSTPHNIDEFRKIVPLTTYQDYAPYIGNCQEDAIVGKPLYWARTSGGGGTVKWAPYYLRNDEVMSKNATAGLIMSTTRHKGEVNIAPGTRALLNFPPRPYTSGWGVFVWIQRNSMNVIPPLEKAEKMPFPERIQLGFMIALRHRTDILSCISSVLIKMGEAFTEGTRTMKFSRSMLHPTVLFRVIRGRVSAARHRRPMLPRDLWSFKGVIGWGVDTEIYKDKIAYYWGQKPYELYVATEAGGMIAINGWNKKALTFTPDTAFYEFIPEDESLKSKDDPAYIPSTLLLDQVEAGKRYELVITSFYGMPFMRYRLGDLIEVVALKDDETGVNLPQIVFHSRADDLVSLAGFTWLNEKIVWQAIAQTNLKYNDWTLRKEYVTKDPFLHLYIELREDRKEQEVEQLIHDQLKLIDTDYADIESMLGIRPLRVTLLSAGSFQRYMEEKSKAGHDLARLRVRHINASDDSMEDLLRLNKQGEQA
ncbi:GH3 auxin-responsive promoter family protein [Chloroflexota bacterium]